MARVAEEGELSPLPFLFVAVLINTHREACGARWAVRLCPPTDERGVSSLRPDLKNRPERA